MSGERCWLRHSSTPRAILETPSGSSTSKGEVVVQAINRVTTSADLAAARAECDAWREYYARRVYRLLQVDKIRGRARVYHFAHERRLRGFTRTLTKEVQSEMDKGEQLVRDERATQGRD